MKVALCVSPHPDDEILGAAGTLLALADQGWSVTNLAVSLGRSADHERRRAELDEATRRAGFANVVADPPIDISAAAAQDGDGVATAELIERLVVDRALEQQAALIVAPSPHDGHHGHELVGRAAWRAARRTGCRLWLWGLWADLPAPSLLVPVPEDSFALADHALDAHAGELRRTDYRRLFRARAEAQAVLGPELVFGFGTAGTGHRYCELLMEIGFDDGAAWLAAPRTLTDSELAPFEPAHPVDRLGTTPSPRRTIHGPDH